MEDQFLSLIRIAAISMIEENSEHSKYGWSHALTIPHGIWSIYNFGDSQLINLNLHLATLLVLDI